MSLVLSPRSAPATASCFPRHALPRRHSVRHRSAPAGHHPRLGRTILMAAHFGYIILWIILTAGNNYTHMYTPIFGHVHKGGGCPPPRRHCSLLLRPQGSLQLWLVAVPARVAVTVELTLLFLCCATPTTTNIPEPLRVPTGRWPGVEGARGFYYFLYKYDDRPSPGASRLR